MVVASFVHLDLVLVKTQLAAVWLFQGEGVRFDLLTMWNHMGWPARAIAIILLIMSAWSIGVMIDRWIAFSAARKQSRKFAPVVAGALREGKLDEAIRVAERNKKSHLARVVTSGLQEFRGDGESTETPGEKIEASKCALERAEAIVHADLEAWPQRPGHDWLNRPIRRAVGDGDRHHRCIPQHSRARGHRSHGSFRGYF
jgi:biopolymer transport protein ExbB